MSLPAAKATLKERADAEAGKLSVKPASPRIRVAVDVSGWLHRLAAFATSAEVIACRVVHHCRALINIGCDVTVVFDGDTNSDAKRATNEARAAHVQTSQAPRRTQEQMFAVVTLCGVLTSAFSSRR